MQKTPNPMIFLFALILLLPFPSLSQAQTTDAAKMLEQMDDVLRGKSHDMTVTLDVKTERWQRHYKIHVQMKGVDFAFARILEPPKVEGQGFLRIKARLWNYLPSAERTILIPSSMMLDKFMGSDFSNDDFVKLSYLPRDYEAKITGEETLDGFEVFHLELTPHPDAPVTYGKLEIWLRKTDSAPVRLYFFNEKMEPIRTLHYSGFKTFGTHEMPSVWRMENHKNKDRETVVTVMDAAFDIPLADSLFARENLEKVP